MANPIETPGNDLDAYSIEEFCRRHGISRSTYYLIQKDGTGPDECRVKNRVQGVGV
jgi:predicted DNA-binding transcriptional regulator AlpA